MPLRPPPYPLHALTSYELSGYRSELERALSEIPDTAPDRGLLRARLADVLMEEKSRTRLSDASDADRTTFGNRQI